MGDYHEYRNRELRPAEGIVTKISFDRRYPGNELISFLIVEGETDKKFYKNIVSNQRCQITIAYSKATAIEVITILDKEHFVGYCL